MNPSSVLPEVFIVALVAPAASVIAANRRAGGAWRIALPILSVIALLVLVSAIAALATRRPSDELRAIVVAHVTLGAAAFATASIGVVCCALFADVLDAAAASAMIAFAVTFALLLAGDIAGQLPPAVVNAGLTASPLVAIGSAANIDVLRDGTWYRLSPIAHRSFNYPAWYQAASCYAAVTLVCVGAIVWKRERSL